MTAPQTGNAPQTGFSAPCVRCGRESPGAVVVGAVERASGSPYVQYACPDDAAKYGAGPSPHDVIR